ncbi:PREDICTED: G-box-binding factor-like [Wasmannia auropunctata]|uniref:G-box-binding factor-like n=1 Tax=Wasmannia auropunctata TaxID=64793 RepID=UPI0005EF96E3|nr:PREDICTED: G-box-binding factor-like [Wasmannia auropunctata]
MMGLQATAGKRKLEGGVGCMEFHMDLGESPSKLGRVDGSWWAMDDSYGPPLNQTSTSYYEMEVSSPCLQTTNPCQPSATSSSQSQQQQQPQQSQQHPSQHHSSSQSPQQAQQQQQQSQQQQQQQQQQQISQSPHQSHHQQQHDAHHHYHQQQPPQHQQAQQYVQLGAREVPIPEGGDNRHPTEASIAPEGRRTDSHMPHSTMHRYGTETLSPTTTDQHHHQQQQHHHHLSEVHQHTALSSVAHRHLEDPQQHHQETDEDVDRGVSSITAAMRGARGDYLGVLFPNLTSSSTTSSNSGSNHHHHHTSHHLEDVLSEEPYLQHQIRAGGAAPTGGGSPSVRTVGGSPTSSHSPHDDQGLSSPHRQAQETGYSPTDQGRLQSFTHLTAMQPPSVQNNHGLQEAERVSDQLYIDSIYTHHASGTPHHHQDQHDQGPSAPHSPSGPLSRLVILVIVISLRAMTRMNVRNVNGVDFKAVIISIIGETTFFLFLHPRFKKS